MKRTTVMLPLDLKNRAEARARAQGVSFGEMVRLALERALAEPAPRGTDPFWDDDDAVFDGEGPTDLAENHDFYLYGPVETTDKGESR